MPKQGKKYRAALAKVDLNKQYTPQEAVALAKDTAYTKFDASVEVHMRTALDPRQADQQVRDVGVRQAVEDPDAQRDRREHRRGTPRVQGDRPSVPQRDPAAV